MIILDCLLIADYTFQIMNIKQAKLHSGKLIDDSDLTDAADIVLRHVKEDPGYIQSAEHTIEGMREWFGRKHLDALWFAEVGEARVGVIALRQHSLIGFAIDPTPDVEVCRLIVAPQARGRKVASALFSAALKEARDCRPWLTVLYDSQAHRMYERWGWQSVGRVDSADDPLDYIVAMVSPE